MGTVNTSPLRAVADVISRNREELSAIAFDMFFATQRDARTRIRATPAIADALTLLARSCDSEGKLPLDVEKRFLQRATTLCAHGLRVDDLEPLAESAHRAMLITAGGQPFELVLPIERALQQLARTVVERLTAYPPQPATEARVAQVQRRSRRYTVVRLEADQAIAYQPGQSVSVSVAFLPGAVEYHYPANPTNEHGQIEFHVFHDPAQAGGSDLTKLMSAAAVGDIWRLGPHSGEEGGWVLDKKREDLLIAHGIGLAPIRTVVIDRLINGPQVRTHLFLSAEYPGELYDLMGLWQIAASSPWLSVTPVSLHDEDPWWVAATEHSAPPRGLHLRKTGEVGEIVSSFGSWGDRDVLIAGPGERVAATVGFMRAAGTPRGHIQTRVCEQPSPWAVGADGRHRANQR